MIDSFLQAIKETLLLAIGPRRYKNGAFAGVATQATSMADDLNFMISSPLVTAHEKRVFEKVKRSVVKLRNMKVQGEKLDTFQVLMESECGHELVKVFSADMKARGEYVPPMMLQTLGENGEIEESILIDKDGGGTRYQGGKPGVVPGAPEAFNKAQEQAHGDLLNRHGKEGSDHHAGGNYLVSISRLAGLGLTYMTGAMRFAEVDTDSEHEVDPTKHHEPTVAAAEPLSEMVKPSQTKPEKSARLAGFGKAFEGNLKNAFL